MGKITKMSAPFDKILVIDFETRWDRKDYTLSKLTTEQYIRDPRFKAFGLAYKDMAEEGAPVWVSHDDIPLWVESINWVS